MQKIKLIDLFAGCGGLSEGFLKTKKYHEIAAVEWLKPQVDTLKNRLITKWNNKLVDESVLYFDIQREDELYNGWDDPLYGKHKGLDYIVNKHKGIDLIIGGPPCQAYSIAGRVRDDQGMNDDYRNFLFEHYLNVVNRYKPKLFIFENVPGILTACPHGINIVERITESFAQIGFTILNDLKKAIVNASDYGVPQNRSRVVILGLNNSYFKNTDSTLENFYFDILAKLKINKKITVKEAIGDLPPCTPFTDEAHHKQKISHHTPECKVSFHIPRYHNLRDMDTFKLLAEDVASGANIYDSKKISELYEMKVGSKSPIHRYHVLNPNQPSTTIIAHLYKDGNRFIHYDPKQQRSITVREAARLQSFPDDYEFICTRGSAYQMIGNAVPPLLAEALAKAVYKIFEGL